MKIKQVSVLGTIHIRIFLVALMFFISFSTQAQKTKSTKKSTEQKTPVKQPIPKKQTQEKEPVRKPEIWNSGNDDQKVRDIVAFLQFMLNTLGDSETSSRDKDVLITESYSKIFRDSKVQVEDDLDEAREVITNKDVVAYLKDVDFFFRNVKFEFTIDEIKGSTLPNGQQFYKVSAQRNLSGVTTDGQTVNNTIPRFIEINFNPEDQDLRIVSIYTNEFDEKAALSNWWQSLSYEWRSLFRRKLNLTDSVTLENIKDVTSIHDLDLSGNRYIQDLEPISRLVGLKVLDISGTPVTDLSPLRNLTELEELNLSKTKIDDLTPLKYATKIRKLDVSGTEVDTIEVFEKMVSMQHLTMSYTKVKDFRPLSNLHELYFLNLSRTKLSSLAPIDSLTKIEIMNVSGSELQGLDGIQNLTKLIALNIDSTRIRELTPLAMLPRLKSLNANLTLISELKPLEKLNALERIYCDQTQITREKADAYMKANPGALVIYDSKDMKQWWESLNTDWKEVFIRHARIGPTPEKEGLAKITNLDSLNISGSSVVDLEPLRKIQKLRSLVANRTSIADLTPLQDHRELEYVDISETSVAEIGVINFFSKLKVFRADKTSIQNIEPLWGLKALTHVYADQTNVHDILAQEFLEKNPGTLLVYKTNHLVRWWQNLSETWKQALHDQMKDTTTSRENLHVLISRESLEIKDKPITYLKELGEFIRLKHLVLSGTGISSIPPLENIKGLRSLQASNCPLEKIDALGQFKELEDLDISNTPIDDLEPLARVKSLVKLNCSGTQIKKLDDLEGLSRLEALDCSNTRVAKLDPISGKGLKSLKCYNTKVSSREVEKFREANPDCNVVYYR